MSSPSITMYATKTCPFCVAARALLQSKGVGWDEILIDVEPAKRDEMMTRSGRRTVPQIFIGDQHIGGFDDLQALEQAGGLDPMLGIA